MSIETNLKDLAELNSWLSNASAVDSQSGRNYVLRMDVGTGTFAYCGQQYAGANNYHNAPYGLKLALNRELEKVSRDCFTRAVSEYRKSLLKTIADKKAEFEETIAKAVAAQEKTDGN